MQFSRSMASFGMGVLLVAIVGCGEPNALQYTVAEVRGTVTYQEEPLENGLIRFVPDGEVLEGQVAGKPVFAKIENGAYSISGEKGVTVGKNRVEITSFRGTGQMLETSGGAKEEEQEQFIPEQYNTVSTLSADIKEGQNTLDFDLK